MGSNDFPEATSFVFNFRRNSEKSKQIRAVMIHGTFGKFIPNLLENKSINALRLFELWDQVQRKRKEFTAHLHSSSLIRADLAVLQRSAVRNYSSKYHVLRCSPFSASRPPMVPWSRETTPRQDAYKFIEYAL